MALDQQLGTGARKKFWPNNPKQCDLTPLGVSETKNLFRCSINFCTLNNLISPSDRRFRFTVRTLNDKAAAHYPAQNTILFLIASVCLCPVAIFLIHQATSRRFSAIVFYLPLRKFWEKRMWSFGCPDFFMLLNFELGVFPATENYFELFKNSYFTDVPTLMLEI